MGGGSGNHTRRAGAALAAALVLTGCTAGGEDPPGQAAGETAPRIVQPGAPGEPSRTLSADELAELEPPPHTRADVTFVQSMIHHHAQALRMTRLVPRRSPREDLPLLAERMDVSQKDEIELMQRWLEERGEEVPEPHLPHGHAHGPGRIPGMLSEDELARLERARGPAFDRLFLEYMIRHHEGALVMVAELYASGEGGQEPEVDALARHVEADQLIEIDRMRQLLAKLG